MHECTKDSLGAMNNFPQIMRILESEYQRFPIPSVSLIAHERDPFKVLVGCLISLRTKDAVTFPAAERLFSLADTPEAMMRLSPTSVEKAIYPASFYRVKAKRIIEISRILIEEFGGKVPDDIDELLELPRVGRKTANLTVTLGYGKLGICVDSHVHQISNRLGFVNTTSPEKTEFALRKILPPRYWIKYNDFLVAFGQNVCVPVSPHCSSCKLSEYCPKIGVGKRR